jgi:hypothetical protein
MSGKPLESDTPESAALGRRAFLGNMGVVAGAVMAASVLPLAVARAASLEPTVTAAPAPTRVVADGSDDLRDIDDMWGHWPRYAHPIPHARVQPAPAAWEKLDPIDRMLVI